MSIIMVLVLTAGCGGALKKNWTNFTAYYNTFYNAKKDFHAGLVKVEAQPVILLSDAMVRPHPKPALAGSDEFNEAIENSAQILRRFPQSKWTDNALLLIGKSYYYLQENFLALQKFEELIALPSDTPLKQKAIIWKGRTLLDISSYSKGIQFLESTLADFKGKWEPGNKAETQVILAEHLAMLGQWDKAARLLEPAMLHIDDSVLKGRSYLLLGQLFQKQHHYARAFQAYSNVKYNYPDYEYIYRADEKKAEVSRLSGKPRQAASIYRAMLSDDKNFKRRNELNYQLAQTYQTEGKYRPAAKIYHEILRNRTDNISNDISAEVYYQLGKIYSEKYNNYELAASYFDSSSGASQQQKKTGLNDADKLSSAYAHYVSMKKEIARIDSLMKLGSLGDKALNIRLAKIRKLRKEAFKNSQNEVQQTNNTLSNIGPEDIYQTASSNSGSADFGFLNYHNQEIVQRNRRKFKAIWGNRPLVDNWRRRAAISGAVIGDSKDTTRRPVKVSAGPEVAEDKQMGINLNEIPRSVQEKQALQKERLNTEYRLGSLFFLTLNQPDSAKFYYQHILYHAQTPSGLKAQVLYSLYELYNLQEKADSATIYKNKIINEYPHSRYARHIFSNEGDVSIVGDEGRPDLTNILRDKVQRLLAHDDTLYSDIEIADKLRQLAVKNQTSPVAPAIYYRSIRKYILLARQQDSLKVLTDSLLAEPPANPDVRLYSTATWDRVRRQLTRFKYLFPRAKQISQINIWLNVLSHPADLQPIETCKELGIKPVISAGKKQFIDAVSLPDKVNRMNLSGSIRYRFVIGEDGRVESYKLLSDSTDLGIEAAYQKAIENILQFEPITQNGTPVHVSCEVEFPIEN